MTNKQIAQNHRNETNQSTGVVVIFNHEVSGWMNELRNPEKWTPGCVAVDADNNEFLAIGGNAYSGADEWARMNEILKNKTQ